MAEGKGKRAPIRRSVHVDCPIEEAFRLFTESFGEWWPLASYSVTGEDAASCELEPWHGGKLLERTRWGEEREWGEIVSWEPPSRLEFTWHPHGGADGQSVEVEFRVDAVGTRVTLTHYGWDKAGVAGNLSAGYAPQWNMVLEVCFGAYVSERVLIGA